MKRTKKRRVAAFAAALAIPAALLSTAETFVAAQETAAVAPSDAETSFAWDDDANLKAGDRKTLEIGGVEFAFRYCPPGAYPAPNLPRRRDFGAPRPKRRGGNGRRLWGRTRALTRLPAFWRKGLTGKIFAASTSRNWRSKTSIGSTADVSRTT